MLGLCRLGTSSSSSTSTLKLLLETGLLRTDDDEGWDNVACEPNRGGDDSSWDDGVWGIGGLTPTGPYFLRSGGGGLDSSLTGVCS